LLSLLLHLPLDLTRYEEDFNDYLLCVCRAFGIRPGQETHAECRLNAMIGYEHPLSYGNAVEIYGEVGNHWQKPTCCRFWKGYYWDGGLVYKQRLVRYKNGMLRFRLGPQFGATQKKFFLGVEAGFEYSYVFQNGWEFSLIQKNNVNFLHGDTFRNGLLLGVKIPF